MIEIPDFEPHAPLPADVIEQYRDRVPAELVEIWEHYGTGTFGQGFFRIIDPAAYERGVGDVLGKVTGQGIAIPVMVSGFADLITWDPGDGMTGIRFRTFDTLGVGPKVSTLFTLTTAGGAKFLSSRWNWDRFPKAVEAHGPLAFDESFVYVPLLSLGGKEQVENLQPRKTIEAIRMMVEMQGLIEH